MDFKKEIAIILSKEVPLKSGEIENLIEVPPNSNLGDFSFPCFTLAKQLKKAPIQIAEELKKKIKLSSSIQEIKNVGPYLNFFVNKSRFTEDILTKILKECESYGYKKSNSKVLLVEYPGPNTNKPLHLGHARNMALGESISRIFAAQGFIVKKININNDRGIHICKSMLAYMRWGKNAKPNKKSDHYVGDYYVLFAKKLNENSKLESEAQELLRKWEAKEEETRRVWKTMNEWALSGFKETYKRFGIKHDKQYYESKTYEQGRKIVLDGLKRGIFEKNNDGAVIIKLENDEKILLRADGTTVYMTQDIYLAKKRYEDYKFYGCIYVVGSEQIYHFKVLFEVFKKLGYKFVDHCHHLNYGMVYLPEGKMKSREGTRVDADNLMDNLHDIAKKEIEKRDIIVKSKIESTAEKVGLAALKYFLLKYTAQKDFVFDPKESISFEGNTGPYLLYSYVRANKILQKAKFDSLKRDYSLLSSSEEIELIKKLGDFEEAICKAAASYSPHILAEYAYHLAASFNVFYEKIPVLNVEKNLLKNSRLDLIKAYTLVIKSSLNLLGIEVVKEM